MGRYIYSILVAIFSFFIPVLAPHYISFILSGPSSIVMSDGAIEVGVGAPAALIGMTGVVVEVVELELELEDEGSRFDMKPAVLLEALSNEPRNVPGCSFGFVTGTAAEVMEKNINISISPRS